MKGKIILGIKIGLVLFVLYLLYFGLLIFLKSPKEENIQVDTGGFYEREDGPDRISLVEDRYDAYLTRMYLLNQAEKSIDMAYYAIEEGESSKAIMGAILKKADQGVKVRILLDGMVGSLGGELKNLVPIFNDHENIEFKCYDPISLFSPKSFNNRLHDKFIIVDGRQYLIGGRNIGDRYLSKNYNINRQVNDRDILVFKDKLGEESSVEEVEDYFLRLWNSKYSRRKDVYVSRSKSARIRQESLEKYEEEMKANLDLQSRPKVLDKSFKTNKVSLVSNPITRGNKYPLVLKTMARLASESQDVKVQSPYILPTKMMKKFVKKDIIDYNNMAIYTNSIYSSPNLFAMSGYIKGKKSVVDSGLKLYEYQGPGSIHGKSYVYDGELSAVGSFNMDNRSSFLSTETMILVHSKDFAEELLKSFESIEKKSFEVGKDYKYIDHKGKSEKASLAKRGIIRLLSIFVYFFDFML